jgi:hypothetical protein
MNSALSMNPASGFDDDPGFVSGHGFSRAVETQKIGGL